MLLQIDQDNAEEETGIDGHADVERCSQRHDPCRERGTDIGTHDDGDSLRQREQSGINKRYSHDSCCCWWLYGGCDDSTCKEPGETIGGHGTQGVS